MTTHAANSDAIVLGWREYVAFPDWNVGWVKAKVDTGAKTSAIDVESHEILPGNRVRFTFRTGRRGRAKRHTIETDIVRHGTVRSSTGHEHERIFVNTRIQIGGIERTVESSLVDRRKMRFRMLLGRTAMEPDLWVNPSVRYLHGRPRGKGKPTAKGGA